jgi:4'-phosphopantetheinyl transferase EntD
VASPVFFEPPVLEMLLPRGVSAVATRSEIEAPLFPEEELGLGSAVEDRRREFTTARACARLALARLGEPLVAIPTDPSGAPRWPAGIVGSITHCSGYRAAAVGKAVDFYAVGIDAEPNLRLPPGVLGAISLSVERERVAELLGDVPGPCWDRLLFSAKEAVFKTWFPLAGRRLDFKDVEVAFDAAQGKFSASFRKRRRGADAAPSPLTGRWAVTAGLLATAIALRAS